MRTLRNGGIWVRGHVMTVLLIGGITGLISLGTMWSMRMPAAVAALVPDGNDVGSAMQRVGLVADCLAAAGVTSGDVSTIVDDVTTYMNANHGSLLSADSDVSDARGRVGRFTRLIQSGTRDRDTVDALATARSDLATAEGDQQRLLDGLFDAATASLEQSEVDTLIVLRGQTGWTMPIQYLCLARTDADLLQLRNAIAHTRIAADRGEDVDPSVEAFLTSRDGQSEVVAASTAVTTHLASVRSTLDTELNF